MAVNRVDTAREIAVPAERLFDLIADYTGRARWLPAAFSDLTVEQGGHGAGTSYRYLLTIGSRARRYHMVATEPQPGRVLVESDTASSLVTTWTVTPRGGGAHVALHTEWQGAGGVGGIFERLFAPPALKRVYESVLTALERQATA